MAEMGVRRQPAFMFGSLEAGAAKMQFESGVSADIIQVIQALVLTLVAAPTIISSLIRWRRVQDEATQQTTLNSSWGS